MVVTESEKRSMIAALNDCRLSELPEALGKDDNRIWARAIAKVKKCDTSVSYALVQYHYEDGYMIMKDEGNSSTIVKIEEIYPTVYLTDEDMPNVSTKQGIVTFLKNHGEDAEQIKALLSDKVGSAKKSEKVMNADKEKVKSLVIKYAIEELLYKIDNAE